MLMWLGRTKRPPGEVRAALAAEKVVHSVVLLTGGPPEPSVDVLVEGEWGEEPMFLDSKHPRRPSKPFKPNWTSPSRTGALGVQEPTVFFKWQ